MTATSNATPVVKEVLLDAPVERVWSAITDHAKMSEWYFKMPEFKPEVGFEFTFIGKGNEGFEYVHLCTVKEVIPNKLLVHSWRYKGFDGDSEVRWELTPDGDKTKLVLTHNGLETFPAVEAFAKENFNKGWTAITGTNLPKYLAK